jgi:GNAT superfamily N-acetyltransferase
MNETLTQKTLSWIEKTIGAPFESFGYGEAAVVPHPPDYDGIPLWGCKIGERAAISCREDWVERVRSIVSGQSLDMLFSTLGTYDLSKVTLPERVGVWGISWFMFADESTLRSVKGHDVIRLTSDEMRELDTAVYWHSFPDDAVAGFAIKEGDRIIALAGVRGAGDGVLEVGMDVLADARGTGLGRAVVSAAGRWILDQGKLVMASTAPFNVPSARTLRAAGLQYGFTAMLGRPGVLKVPPQPLGLPYPGAEVFNLYPDSAMNKDIRPRPS